MPHRSISTRTLDEAAFPVRLKLHVPPHGFGHALIDILQWLRREVGDGNFARHEAETLEEEALEIHSRRLEDAATFMGAFPELRLADGTASRLYTRHRLSSRPFPLAEAAKRL